MPPMVRPGEPGWAAAGPARAAQGFRGSERLRAASRVVLRALKRYGMILADNGSPWYVTGAPDPGRDDDDLHDLHAVTGADFEVVETRTLRNGAP